MKKKMILGVGITDATQDKILEYILQSLEKKGKNYFIVTPNPEILVYAHHHPSFKSILNEAEIALCDGIGVLLAGILEAKFFSGRVTGVDLMENLCKEISDRPITVGFLGGRENVAVRTADCLQKKYPGLKVAFAEAEWSEESSSRGSSSHAARDAQQPLEENSKNTPSSLSESRHPRSIREEDESESTFNSLAGEQAPFDMYKFNIGEQLWSKTTKEGLPNIDILFVAYGFPKQEEWMKEHINKVPVRVMIGVGGAFDYISGKVMRAPSPLRSVGLEWLFRLIRQPWRFKRQQALVEFIRLVFKS